jgi:hypothetical protein
MNRSEAFSPPNGRFSMTTDIIPGTNFVAPHFIPELGEEGLTLHEIAKSLGIEFKHAKAAYEKNINDYSGVEISAPSGNPVNPVVLSYALNTEDSKFFVSGYNNAVGKAYRRYLIQCEKVVMKMTSLVPPPHSNAKIILKETLEIYGLLGVPKHLAQIECVKEVQRVTGLDFSHALQLTPAQDDIKDEEVMLEPQELAPILGFTSAVAVNKALAEAGLQVKDGKSWKPSPYGSQYCVRHAWTKGTKSGYNWKWHVEKVRGLIALKA